MVYFGQYAGDDALLSEFKIQNGIGQTGIYAASSGRCGGGIFIDANASPQLLKLHVTNNQAESKGAGIFKNTGGTLKISLASLISTLEQKIRNVTVVALEETVVEKDR